MQAVDLLEAGNEEQATVEVQHALERDPNNKLALSLMRQITFDPQATLGREWFASDREGGAAALLVWLPRAKQGDKIAQAYVGEIFEKGLGAQPDYQAAATWYRKAAEQGYSRAMINLGFLYEKGLGVAKDPVEALNLYRRAAGLDQAIRIDTGTPTDRDAELNELRGELERARQQLNRANQELEQERARSKQEFDKLRSDQKAAASAGDITETQRLEKALLEKEAASKRRESEVALLQQAANRQREQVAALERESSALKAATRDQIQQPVAQPSKPGVPVAGPSIQLIDPELVITRGSVVVPLRGDLKYRDVVGRVVAPAGLLLFTVNNRTLTPDRNGLFKTRVDILTSATKVTFVAVDRAGSSARMDFLFQPEHGRDKPTAPCPTDELAKFPWPEPPQPTATDTISLALLFGSDYVESESMSDVAARLKRAVQSAGYRNPKFLGVGCDGFAMVLDLEHIQADGTRVAGNDGWALPSQETEFTLSSFIKRLFYAPPGRYRQIVFVLSKQPMLEATPAPSGAELSAITSNAGRPLSSKFESVLFTETHFVRVLVYEFEKRLDSTEAKIAPPPGRLGALVHLKLARLF
jgi:hypothetical protein